VYPTAERNNAIDYSRRRPRAAQFSVPLVGELR